MASHRVGETGVSESGPSSRYIPYPLLYGINNPSTTFINEDGGAFSFGELEQAIVLQGQGVKNKNDEHKAPFFTARPAATLEMFPSWPIRFQQTPRPQGGSRSRKESNDSGSALNAHTTTSNAEAAHLEGPESPMSKKASPSDHQAFIQKHLQIQQQLRPEMAIDVSTSGPSLNQSPQEKRKGCGSTSEKQLDAKTLRRLAQNREAARKSRLRKKAYVQQLESSRIKLTQLEQDLQRTRSQGMFLGAAGANVSSGAALFDMEYARWLEDDHRHMAELRGGLNAHLSDGDLRVMVDACICHYDEIFRLKGAAAKSDVFHLITGMWMSPAERCFLWIGGFRPSDLIKMLISQIDPITEQQVMEIYKLQQSSQQAEEALSQGLDQLHHALIETITGGPVIDGINQMVLAMGKLSSLECFIHQGDILRQQTLHQLHRILTVRQAARCFVIMGEYYSRLRALSSLWASRPRETSLIIGEDDTYISCQATQQLHRVLPSNQDGAF